jgi:RNA polymerase subunit RPABC4/transcription elongation factor Spt4
MSVETWICPACGETTDEPAWIGLANPASPAVCPTCHEVVELEINPAWDAEPAEAAEGAR